MGVLAPASSVLAQNTPRPTAPPTAARPVAGVAAEVGGEKILEADVNRILDSIREGEPAFKTGTPEAKKALAEMRVQILDDLITTRVLAQEAARRKITAPAAEVNKAVADIKSSFKTEAEFLAALKTEGKTPDDLRKVIADELVIRDLSKQLTLDVVVTPADFAEYYRANLKQFTIPEGLKAHHILLAINPGAPQSEKDRVKKRAQDLLRQLQKEDFEKVAKANSDDPGSKDAGGNLGAITRGDMVKPFEEAAFAAPVSKVVGPVETVFGFHLIRVDEKLPERTVPLAEVQANPQMKAFLLKRKVQARLEQEIDKFKGQTRIVKTP